VPARKQHNRPRIAVRFVAQPRRDAYRPRRLVTDERPPEPDATSAPSGGDAPIASPTHAPPFSGAPLLAGLAAIASLVDTLVSRLAAPTLASRAPLPVTRAVFATGDVAMNLAAITGLVALGGILLEVLRRGRFGSLFHRLTIAGFAGVFLPSVALSAALPRAHTTPQLVIVTTGAAFVLAVLFGMSALPARSPLPLRIAVGLVTIGAAASLLSMLLLYAPWMRQRGGGEVGVALLAHIAELAWLGTPVCAALALRPDLRSRRGRTALVLALATGTALSLGFRMLRAVARSQLGDVLYYALRVQLLLEAAPLAYTIGVTLAVMLAVVALLARESWRRQLGAAVLLLVAAGVTPRMPGTLLMFVLGATMLGRLALAQAAEATRATDPVRDDAQRPD